jgi:hypothetical protein
MTSPGHEMLLVTKPHWSWPIKLVMTTLVLYYTRPNKTKKPFIQPFSVFVSQGQLAKKFKNLTLDAKI